MAGFRGLMRLDNRVASSSRTASTFRSVRWSASHASSSALSLHHVPIPVAIAFAVFSGAGIGLVSGLLIAYFDLAAFVITLGVMAIGRSLAYIFSGQTSISDMPPELYTTVLGVQTNVWTLLLLYALAWGYLTYTKGGRTIYAVGSNRKAARTAGLDVLFYSVLPYVVSGALSAVAATLSSPQGLTYSDRTSQRVFG